MSRAALAATLFAVASTVSCSAGGPTTSGPTPSQQLVTPDVFVGPIMGVGSTLSVTPDTAIAFLSEPGAPPEVSGNSSVLQQVASGPHMFGTTIETVFRAVQVGTVDVRMPDGAGVSISVVESHPPSPIAANRPAVLLARGNTPAFLDVFPGTMIEADLNPAPLEVPSAPDDSVVRLVKQTTEDDDTMRVFWRAVAPGTAEVRTHYGVACPVPPYPCATGYGFTVSVLATSDYAVPASPTATRSQPSGTRHG